MFAFKLLLAGALSMLPSLLKVPIYRLLFRYRIGRGVKLGFGSVFVGVKRCRIGARTRIGYFNMFLGVGELEIGEHVRIGHLNLLRGGERIAIGDYATILRKNVLNAIREPLAVNELASQLELGAGSVVTTGHWLDFTDRIVVGEHTIIGGRSSSFWTHNRQRTRQIVISPHCYIGSESRFAPGVELAAQSIVALGSVLLGRFDQPRTLLGGNPACVIRELSDRDLFLVTEKTRPDIPDQVVAASVAALELHVAGNRCDAQGCFTK